MAEDRTMAHGGWGVTRSIALELDVALSLFSGYDRQVTLPGEAAATVQSVPEDWKGQWRRFLGPPRKWISVLMQIATLAGVLAEEDYSRATLAMRELTLEDAIQAAEDKVRTYGLDPGSGLAPEAHLTHLTAQLVVAMCQSLGLTAASQETWVKEASAEAERAIPLLRGGREHAPFWLWLDRFYFEFYRPWRERKLPLMEAEQARALAALGALTGDTPPPVSWLPRENPLLFQPELADAVQSGKGRVLFWTQPFGFFDYFSLSPGMVVITYGLPDRPLADYLRQDAESLAERAKALSDGTRLMLLRIIRDFAMDNTQMADLLGIARPTVSVHAKILREAGLIDTGRDGRASVHTLNASAVRQLFREIERFLQLPAADDEP